MNKKTLKTLSFFLHQAWKQKPSFFLWFFLGIASRGFFPFINILFPKYLIEELMGSKNISRILILTLLIVLGNMLFSYAYTFCELRIYRLHTWFERYFSREFSRQTMSTPFANTENPALLSLGHKAMEGMGWYSFGLYGIMLAFQKSIAALITLLGVIFIVINTSFLLFAIVLISVIFSSLIVKQINKIDIAVFEKGPIVNRAFWYLGWKLCDARYGKDIRLYGADEMMLKKCGESFKDINEVFRVQAEGTSKWGCVNAFVSFIRNIGIYLYLGYQLTNGFLSIANFTMLITASNTLREGLQTLITQLQDLQKKAGFMDAYREFMQVTSSSEACLSNTEKIPAKCPLIEFKNVSFHYPGSETMILNNINISINPGEHLSVVGLNGAGKTTFIKLLCRLYDVCEGEILINGVNINSYPITEYRHLLSVVFQDFKLLSLTIKENIMLGDRKRKEGNIENYIDLCSLREKVSSIKEGSETLLYKYFDQSGIEPSGGEAQKIAIARALYKEAPVVILDEPTAALDPVAEYEIYKQFDQLVGGKTAVYISHRLSSCKFCDKIAVFANHTILEYGTHDELLALTDGLYAKMFQAQAQYYV